MTDKEIIEMAEKCGIKLITDEDDHIGFLPRKIYEFAKLIAEKEREECAEAVEGYRKQRTHETWYKAEEQIRARGQE